jgi:hypothetical protein
MERRILREEICTGWPSDLLLTWYRSIDLDPFTGKIVYSNEQYTDFNH